jgi:hypothetical protein
MAPQVLNLLLFRKAYIFSFFITSMMTLGFLLLEKPKSGKTIVFTIYRSASRSLPVRQISPASQPKRSRVRELPDYAGM